MVEPHNVQPTSQLLHREGIIFEIKTLNPRKGRYRVKPLFAACTEQSQRAAAVKLRHLRRLQPEPEIRLLSGTTARSTNRPSLKSPGPLRALVLTDRGCGQRASLFTLANVRIHIEKRCSQSMEKLHSPGNLVCF
jgi:hypothetical protein